MKRPSDFFGGLFLCFFGFLFCRRLFVCSFSGRGFFCSLGGLGFLFFLYGIAEGTQLFAQTIVCAVGIADGFCLIKMEFACFVQEFIADLYGYYFRQEHVMGAQRNDLFYLAFDIHRAFVNDRSIHFFAFFGCQVHDFEFVHISAAAYAAEIAGIGQFFCDQIDDEFAFFLDDVVGMAAGTDDT